jgi:hypothetical protein
MSTAGSLCSPRRLARNFVVKAEAHEGLTFDIRIGAVNGSTTTLAKQILRRSARAIPVECLQARFPRGIATRFGVSARVSGGDPG